MFVQTLLRDPGYFLAVVAVVIVSVTIHELFHAVAAWSQGDDTAVRAGRLTLNPWVHMGPSSLVMLLLAGIAWGQTPVNPLRFRYRISAALVSFAGPFANLLLMALSLVLLRVGVPPVEAAQQVLVLAALLNAFLFLLNMLPVPPLDGFGILETFVPRLRPYAHGLSQYGFLLLLVLFLFFGLGGMLMDAARAMVAGLRDLLWQAL